MGFIRFRSPLVYPGGSPGFNPSHPAAGRGMRFSGAATGNGMVSVFRPGGGNTSGTVTNQITGSGPSIFTSASVASNVLFPQTVNETPTAVTFAAIFTYIHVAVVSEAIILSVTSTTNITQALALSIGGAPGIQMLDVSAGGVLVGGNIVLPVSVPFFIAVSYNGSRYNLVLRNLNTGAIQTDTLTNVKTFAASTGTSYVVGGFGAANNTMGGNLSAVMFSANNFMSLLQLLQWAQAPWDFWYPSIAASLAPSLANRATTTGAQARVMVMA